MVDPVPVCGGLSAREVLAHLTAAGSMDGFRWLAGVVRCRFDFDRQVAMRLAEQLGPSPAETLARFERVVRSTTSPPLPVLALLGEVVVHGEDIRRPLGITHAHPIDVLTRVARHYGGSDQVVLARGRVRGLRLQAVDGPFTIGSGPLVTGRTLALMMAMTGRRAFCDELTGTGSLRCGPAAGVRRPASAAPGGDDRSEKYATAAGTAAARW